MTIPTGYPSYMDTAKYIRECQDCGYKAEYKDVATYKGDSWRDTKCKKCKNDALDYGSWRHADDCQCLYCVGDDY